MFNYIKNILKMKKFIFAAVFAVSALGITSCNSDGDPIEYSPQTLFTLDISNLTRNGLFLILAYEESISAQIAEGRTLDPSIVIDKNASDEIIGWSSNFGNAQTVLSGNIIITCNGGLLADGVTKIIDCSGIKIGETKFFGTIEVTNNNTTSTEKTIDIVTDNFGWGQTSLDLSLNANYTLKYKFNPEYGMTDTKLSGSATGNHRTYGSYIQSITSDLVMGSSSYFSVGGMELQAMGIDGGLFPIEARFYQTGFSIIYNGVTENY